MNERTLNIILIISVVAFLIGGIFLVKFFQGKNYKGVGQIEINPASFNFGAVSLAGGQVETIFEIKNAGQSDLVIKGATTSCDCTSARFKVKDQESPVFGMHDNKNNWSTTLKPGENGQMIVIYNPKVHPVSGPVTRAVTILSNDPKGASVFVEANVQP